MNCWLLFAVGVYGSGGFVDLVADAVVLVCDMGLFPVVWVLSCVVCGC